MATTFDNTTNYSGKFAGEYIKAAFQANDSLQYLTVKENIEYKAVVKRIGGELAFSDATCAFTPNNTVNLSERYLTLKKLQLPLELCINELLTDYTSKDIQMGKLNGDMENAILTWLLEGIAATNESHIWVGNGATAGQYDGLLKLIEADSDGDVNFITPATITTTNIFAEIQKVINAMPLAVKQSAEKPLLYMSQDVWEIFMYANAAAGNGWYTYTGPEVPKTFMGLYNIAVVAGLPANTMVMARKSNLWFGTNVLSDWNNIVIKNMQEFGEDNIRINAKFFAGTQYGIGSEIVAYSTWF